MIKSTEYLLLGCISCLLFLATCTKKDAAKNNETTRLDADRLDSDVAYYTSLSKVPGLQLVYQKGGKEYSYNKGVKNSNTNEAIDENTIFQAASMSKPLAAYIFLRLADRGVFDLDQPISTYYTYKRLGDNPYNLLVTARHILLHTGGFVNWTTPVDAALNTQFLPGSKYMYSGEGFQYLQMAIEHITQKSLNQLAIEEVFTPFGMTRSAYHVTDTFRDNMSGGHDIDRFYVTTAFNEDNAAFSLLTTASDYAKFIRKVYIEKVGLSEKMYKEMITVGALEVSTNQNMGRGLGIGVHHNEKGVAYYHGGSNAGFRAFFMVFPSSAEFFVFLSNSSAGYNLRQPFLDLFFQDNFTAYFL